MYAWVLAGESHEIHPAAYIIIIIIITATTIITTI